MEGEIFTEKKLIFYIKERDNFASQYSFLMKYINNFASWKKNPEEYIFNKKVLSFIQKNFAFNTFLALRYQRTWAALAIAYNMNVDFKLSKW